MAENYDYLHAKLDRGEGTVKEAFGYYERFLRHPDIDEIGKELKSKTKTPITYKCCYVSFIPIFSQIIIILLWMCNAGEESPFFRALWLGSRFIFLMVLAIQIIALILLFMFVNISDTEWYSRIDKNETQNKSLRRTVESKYNVFVFSDNELNTFLQKHGSNNRYTYGGSCCIDGHTPVNPEERKCCATSCANCPVLLKYKHDLIDRVLDDKM